ncbi:hypothetical protein KCP75_22970 [Salmonella enterica subsp. enterica]|nr:hypothetical protein KCP75_22970 [Salmonella enterica subsp. enterica]
MQHIPPSPDYSTRRVARQFVPGRPGVVFDFQQNPTILPSRQVGYYLYRKQISITPTKGISPQSNSRRGVWHE